MILTLYLIAETGSDRVMISRHYPADYAKSRNPDISRVFEILVDLPSVSVTDGRVHVSGMAVKEVV